MQSCWQSLQGLRGGAICLSVSCGGAIIIIMIDRTIAITPSADQARETLSPPRGPLLALDSTCHWILVFLSVRIGWPQAASVGELDASLPQLHVLHSECLWVEKRMSCHAAHR